MNCDNAQAGLSLAMDGELPADRAEPLADHVSACPACTRFNDQLRAIRQGLRLEALGEVPDVAPKVLTAIRGTTRPRRRRLAPLAAAFVTGALVGATFIGVGGGRSTRVANADIPDRVVAAQQAVTSVAADLRLVERGWHQGIRERLFTGKLRYQAPESLRVELVDRTRYPSAAWVRTDLELVVTGDRWWMRAARPCPVGPLPECSQGKPVVRLVTRREPFAETWSRQCEALRWPAHQWPWGPSASAVAARSGSSPQSLRFSRCSPASTQPVISVASIPRTEPSSGSTRRPWYHWRCV
jgi:hypothetical protein